MVMVCHYRVFWVSGPSYFDLTATGVDLFFVLSGYVFAPTILNGVSSYWAFMIRRLFRMYPLYLIALVVYALLRTQSGEVMWAPLWAHILMLQTSISSTITFFYNPAFWSLPAEWEFYCLMPVLVWCAKSRGLWFCLIMAIVARIGFGFWVVPPTLESPFFNWASWSVVNLPGILSEFLIGTSVYVLAHLKPQLQSMRKWVAVFVCIVLFALFWFYPYVWVSGQNPAWGNLVGLCAALIYGLLLWLSLTVSSRGPAWIVWISLRMGALSYGIYLFHNAAPEVIQYFQWSLTRLQTTLVSLAMTLIAAAVLHRLVEAPCRAYGRYLSTKIKLAQTQSRSM